MAFLLAGDLDTGKAILRDYINATIRFEELSDMTHTPTKSLMRIGAFLGIQIGWGVSWLFARKIPREANCDDARTRGR